MASLSLKHIYKIYPNGFEAVKDFNLEVEDKEFIIFVGPSGCGKSTTLRMIAGLEDISDGEFLIDGKIMNDVEPKDRDIAMVFQNYALYPHMTVKENMAFGLKLRKIPKHEINKSVKDASYILDLQDLLERKPAALVICAACHSGPVDGRAPRLKFQRIKNLDLTRTVKKFATHPPFYARRLLRISFENFHSYGSFGITQTAGFKRKLAGHLHFRRLYPFLSIARIGINHSSSILCTTNCTQCITYFIKRIIPFFVITQYIHSSIDTCCIWSPKKFFFFALIVFCTFPFF